MWQNETFRPNFGAGRGSKKIFGLGMTLDGVKIFIFATYLVHYNTKNYLYVM